MKRSVSSWIAIVVLAVFGIGGIVGGITAVRMVDSNLKEQAITFAKDSPYAGQKVDNGLQAYRFQKEIKKHVSAALNPAGFKTYEEVSAAARATVTTANPAGDAKLMGLRRTALDGNLLRGTLFSSFAWWLVGWVGILAGAAFLVLAYVVFAVSGKPSTLYFPAGQSAPEKAAV